MKIRENGRAKKITVDIFMMLFLILSFVRWEYSNFVFHAVVGTGCALFFILHVCIHWKWLKAVTKSFLDGRLKKLIRWKYAIDILLLVVWGIAIVSGFLAVGYFSFGIEGMARFGRFHGITSRVGLGLVIIHVFQHIPQILSYLGLKK